MKLQHLAEWLLTAAFTCGAMSMAVLSNAGTTGIIAGGVIAVAGLFCLVQWFRVRNRVKRELGPTALAIQDSAEWRLGLGLILCLFGVFLFWAGFGEVHGGPGVVMGIFLFAAGLFPLRSWWSVRRTQSPESAFVTRKESRQPGK